MDNAAPPPNPVPAPAAPPEAEPDYSAGFWLRGGAYMIDGLLVAVVSIVLNLLLPDAVSVIARILLSAAYFTLLPVRADGQTLGKMAAGIAIIRDDGSPLTYGRAFARWLGYLASGLTFCLGFVCAAFTNRKRALHDYIADTRVVRVQDIGAGRKLAVVLTGILFPLLIAAGLVAAVALPNFERMQGVADEGVAKGRLAALRAAAASYYADAQGKYPADLNALAPKYVPAIDPPGIPGAAAVPGVETYGPEVCSGSKDPGQELVAEKLRGTGKWGYVAAPGAPCDGTIFIDSALQDSKGSAWYTY